MRRNSKSPRIRMFVFSLPALLSNHRPTAFGCRREVFHRSLFNFAAFLSVQWASAVTSALTCADACWRAHTCLQEMTGSGVKKLAHRASTAHQLTPGSSEDNVEFFYPEHTRFGTSWELLQQLVDDWTGSISVTLTLTWRSKPLYKPRPPSVSASMLLHRG